MSDRRRLRDAMHTEISAAETLSATTLYWIFGILMAAGAGALGYVLREIGLIWKGLEARDLRSSDFREEILKTMATRHDLKEARDEIVQAVRQSRGARSTV